MDFPHAFAQHMREGSEQLAEPDCEDQVDEMDRFIEGRKLAGLTGNRAANNARIQSEEIDQTFRAKLAAGREAIERSSGDATIAKADHGPHGTTRTYNPATRTAKVTTVDAAGCRMHVEEDVDE